MTDGTEYATPLDLWRARRGAPSRHRLEDPPGLTGGGQHMVDRAGRVSRFKNRYKGIMEG